MNKSWTRLGGMSLAMSCIIILSGCEWTSRTSDQPPAESETPTESPSVAGGAIAVASPVPDRPEVTTKTITVEGEPLELTLRLFSDEAAPFTTYVPTAEFVTDVEPESDRTVVTFYANFGGEVNQEVFLQVVTPKTNSGLLPLDQAEASLAEQIMGESGLLVTNSWQLVDYTDVVIYEWAAEHIQFRSVLPNETITGHIYIGNYNNQEFYVLIHYPAEYAEGFDPRADIILEELKLIPPASN